MQESAAKKIVELGYKLILTDHNSQCICARYADEFVVCDTFDLGGNQLAAQVLSEKYEISAVLTVAADCHETVARISRQLNLHGIAPEISRNCRQKNITRELLTGAGIPQPKFLCVNNFTDAKIFLSSLGGRGVIKSTDNSGSRGFSKLNSLADLTEDILQLSISSGTSGFALIEEALIPRTDCISELSVETLWFNGKMYWLNWVDRLFRPDLKFFPELALYQEGYVNWGVEIGHINPAQHPIELKVQVQKMIHAAGVALGMANENGGHILKADIMLTESGPIIIELTPRLSGGWDSSATTPARGADFQGGIIKLALGSKLDLDLWQKYFEFKNASLYATILADISPDAKNCIGRRFSLGYDFDRSKSIQSSLINLKENKYVL